MELDWGSPLVVFGFVLLIVLIGSLFEYLKSRSAHRLIGELAASGRDIDPALLDGLRGDRTSSARGLMIGGAIMCAVAVALALFGRELGSITGDEEVGPVLRAVAIFPGMVGAVMFLIGVVVGLVDRGEKGDA